MEAPQANKRRKPVFAPMKIKVDKAPEELVPIPKLELSLDRLKAAPQAFDGSVLGSVAKTLAKAEEEKPEVVEPKPVAVEPKPEAKEKPVVKKNIIEPSPEPTTKPVKSKPTERKVSPVQKIMNTYKAQEEGEVYADPYKIKTPPPAWIPPTRRGFTKFFDSTFAKEGEYAAQFTLKPKPFGAKDVDACKKQSSKEGVVEAFLYQQFVREYLRAESPYRGLLVYHGLGSGKTCSAISAAEALFGAGNKKIIVMTPSSLRSNFLSEISKCGFRHYRFNNHWIPLHLERANPGIDAMSLQNFATNILGIPESHLNKVRRYPQPERRVIWIPNFDAEPNYKSLDSTAQSDIRAQVLAIQQSRIQFINYNGITAKRMKQWVCDAAKNPDQPGPFDNAVIIIDEIHNISNLMEGKLHYFMEETAAPKGGRKRLIAPEPVTPERWQPRLCGIDKNYSRGFLLYRLIAEARNSKVIGLSGTPLINFPDEFGPLFNMIGGYTHGAKFNMLDKSESSRAIVRDILNKHPRIDFVEFTPGQLDVQVLITTFPDGYVKVLDGKGDFMGVREVAEDEPSQTTKQVVEEVMETAKAVGIKFKAEPQLISYPILPVNPKEFNKYFVNVESSKPEHVNVLKKRLYGLVSYYKGASEDFMPQIKEDIVVPVRLSDYALNYYTVRRVKEIEERPKDLLADQDVINPYDEALELGQKTNPSNYRFNSRAACNFAFPPAIRRPYRSIKKEEDLSVETDEGKGQQIVSEAAFEVVADEEQPEEDQEAAKEEEATLAEVKEELKADAAEEAVAETEDLTDPKLKRALQDFMMKAEEEAKARGFSIKDADETPQARLEPYDVRLQKALNTLRLQRGIYLKLNGTPDNNLEKYSPKFAEMIRRIDDPDTVPGSSLVYSMFNTAEGLGIFGYALEANGYVHLQVTGSLTDPDLTPEAEASLRKGPAAGEKRFTFFNGAIPVAHRRVVLNLFNGNLEDLPPKIKKIMMESGYQQKGNKKGEICKVIGITAAGAEGISLKCVRAVHIMEPFWNDVRTEQVKGRAVRICSHEDLPPDQRTVSVFTYVVKFTEEDLKTKRVIETLKTRDKGETSDEHVYKISQGKAKLSKAFLKILKEVSVDCILNSAESEPDLKCYLGMEGEIKDYTVQPDIKTNVAAGEIEERVMGKKGAVAAGEELANMKVRPTIVFQGKTYILDRDPESADPNMFLGYDELDRKLVTPLIRAKKDPITGTFKAKKL